MVRVGGMDPDKRQEIVETESFLIDGQNGMGGPCNRQERVETESFLIDGQRWYGGDLVTDKKW